MIHRDLLGSIEIVKVVAPLDVTDNTPFVGAVIDHSKYSGGYYAIMSGVLADAGAEWTVLLEEDDAVGMGTKNAVADEDLLPAGTGQEAAASFTQANDGVVKTIGYRGTKRYTRLTLTPTNNASSGPFAIVFVGMPRLRGEVDGA